MSQQKTSIVIVGGGSSGWMAANYLARVLTSTNNRFSITVIESAAIGTIGVGEATIPTIRQFFELIEVPEIELLIKTNATLKTAIRFDDWLKEGHRYYHPFEEPAFSDGIDIAHHWAAAKLRGEEPGAFDASTGVIAKLCEQNKVTKPFNSPAYQGPSGYAYHLDASLLGDYLRDLAVKKGVLRIEGTVTNVVLDEDGYIQALEKGDGQMVHGDFFVDCTGFHGLLIEKTLGAGYHSYNDELLCNSAVAMPTKHAEHQPLRSYTVATAKEAGWIWQIDLSSRRGNGYVYSDAYINADHALKTLADHAGQPVSETDANHIRMRVGRRNEFWKKNCLALGLSGGFIEPLESTGIQLVDMGLRLLFDHFSNTRHCQPLRDRYNQLMVDIYDEIKDFIVLHYYLSERRDSDFWRRATDGAILSPRLENLLELWKHKLPSEPDFSTINIFRHFNFQYILAGMNRLVPSENQLLQTIDAARGQRIFSEMAKIQQAALRSSPSQKDYITRMRAPFGG